ncbi:hypothetical protein HMPREF9441_00874 [Paraprevotella clara YIT 11840]|uniref:Uncharacterized protein n=1 Tax=Paraprevotella clara YIT 11840 TaxID=762968 RepID=G5SNE5_9BACT|nr:hypothetical protein HMPREF9441_00874 [Paraprevotella clara YIT 11840]
MFEAFVSIFSTNTTFRNKICPSRKKPPSFISYSQPKKNKTIKYRAFYQV